MIPEHLLEESMGSTWDLQFLEGMLDITTQINTRMLCDDSSLNMLLLANKT
jgi:hypothetical protein